MSDPWNTSENHDSQPGDRPGYPQGQPSIPPLPPVPDAIPTPTPPPIPSQYNSASQSGPRYQAPVGQQGQYGYGGPKKKKRSGSWVGMIILGVFLLHVGLPLVGGALYFALSAFSGDEEFSEYADAIDPHEKLVRKANRYFDQEAYQKALIVTDQILALDPGHPKGLVLKGDALRLLSRDMEAVSSYRKALQRARGGTKALAEYGLAAALIDAPENTDYSEAERLLMQAPESGLMREENYFGLAGKMYYFMGDHEKALRLMQRALDLDPNHLVSLHYRGMLLEEEGHYQDALIDLNQALALDENGYTRLTRGKAYYQLSDFDKAEVDLKKAADLIHDDPEPHQYLAYIYEEQQKYDEALESLKKGLAIESDDRAHQVYLATLLNSQGKGLTAVEHLMTLEELYPDYDNYHWERSLIMWEQGDLLEAIRAMEAYVGMTMEAEDRLHGLTELQEMYLEVRGYEGLFYTLDRIQQLRLLRPVEWVWKSQAHRAMNDQHAMLATFEAALRYYPGNQLLSKWYADALYQHERFEEALALVNELGRAWPEDEWSFYQKAMMLACHDDRALRNAAEAVIALKQAGKLVPENERSSWYWSIHAAVYAESGQFEKAVEAQTRAIFQADDDEILEYEAEMRWYQNQEPYGGSLEPKPKDGPTNSGGNEA